MSGAIEKVRARDGMLGFEARGDGAYGAMPQPEGVDSRSD